MFHDLVQRVFRQLTAGASPRRQSAERLGDLLRGNPANLLDGFAENQLGEERSAGNCRLASAYAESSGGNAAVFNAHRQPQFVAAYGIGDVHGVGRVREIAEVAGMLGVFEHDCAVHDSSIPAWSSSCNLARSSEGGVRASCTAESRVPERTVGLRD